MSEPGFECPECGTKLNSSARCAICGWKRHDDTPPAFSCWTCQRCGTYSPGQPVIALPDGPNGARQGLCGTCHFDVRIRPYRSEATDVCDAPECEGRERHLISRHIAELRAFVARIQERSEPVRL